MNEQEIAAALGFAEEVLQEAGSIALRYFRRSLTVHDKGHDGHFDPVTEADREIETHIRARIRARYPEHGILGEEHGEHGSASRVSWIIDPIDGTRAFISGVPAWGILLGLREDARCVAGLVHQPYLEETFVGGPGGAWLSRRGERRALVARPGSHLAQAILYCTHPSMFERESDLAAFQRIAAACRLMRYGGDCYSYCLLALGCVDLVIEGGLQPYDIQPLIPIIEAAGGVVSDARGESAASGGFVVAAANRELHREVLELLNPG